MKVGSLVMYKSSHRRDCLNDLKAHLNWHELRPRVLDGEICIILELDNQNKDADKKISEFDIKILSSKGLVTWSISNFFKLIE